MTTTRNRYLVRRGERWYYFRRIPKRYAHIDARTYRKAALNTDSLTVARERRDAMADADENLWDAALSELGNNPTPEVAKVCRYRSAQRRAQAIGVLFKPAEELAANATLEDIVNRVQIATQKGQSEVIADAVLGAIEEPELNVRDALELYFDKLAVDDLRRKSDAQAAKWRLPKQRAVENFISLCGNLRMNQIDRSHGRAFYEWWGERLNPSDGSKAMRPNSANRDLGNMRKLFREYWTYEGQESRENPFRNLRFSDEGVETRPAFSNEWVLEKIIKPGVFDGLNEQAMLIVYALIETGCRPSEIANLTEEDIHLDVEIPYISIRPKAKRQLKSKSSKRDIPLVGVSLEAMKQAPNGFPHYRDKSSLLSSSLMKAFRVRNLLETERHTIYSFRHAFEKRMLEAGLDYGLRCTLMGHKNSRPEYGDGGSLRFRRDELLKIVHRFL